MRLAAAIVLLTAGTARADALDLPAPAEPEQATVSERGESPTYYRLRDDEVSFLLRSGLGLHERLPVSGEINEHFFTFDVLAGLEIGPREGAPALITELGYSYVHESEHWFLLGLGPELRRLDAPESLEDGGWTIAIVPHGTVGTVDDVFAAGVRTSLFIRYWMAA